MRDFIIDVSYINTNIYMKETLNVYKISYIFLLVNKMWFNSKNAFIYTLIDLWYILKILNFSEKALFIITIKKSYFTSDVCCLTDSYRRVTLGVGRDNTLDNMEEILGKISSNILNSTSKTMVSIYLFI